MGENSGERDVKGDMRGESLYLQSHIMETSNNNNDKEKILQHKN